MPQFSKTSRQRLETCHQDLQTIFNYVVKYFDCTIVCGHRDKIAQNTAYSDNYSLTTPEKSTLNNSDKWVIHNGKVVKY